jgi:hypothetical protein
MTVGSAPTATAVRSPRPGPIRRIGLAAVVVLGPLSITILSANPAYQSADDATTIAAKETICGGVLCDAAERAPDAVALMAGTPDPAARRRVSYTDLLAEAERAARALLGRFAPGERVAVWAPNIPQWTVLQFGAALAGMTPVTVNPLCWRDPVATSRFRRWP